MEQLELGIIEADLSFGRKLAILFNRHRVSAELHADQEPLLGRLPDHPSRSDSAEPGQQAGQRSAGPASDAQALAHPLYPVGRAERRDEHNRSAVGRSRRLDQLRVAVQRTSRTHPGGAPPRQVGLRQRQAYDRHLRLAALPLRCQLLGPDGSECALTQRNMNWSVW